VLGPVKQPIEYTLTIGAEMLVANFKADAFNRFLKAIKISEAIATEHKKIDWLDIINQCGYYDQSQLIHDFKHFLHLSPNQFLKFQQDICVAGLS
jgi:AraC-like DNA-binding protein